MYRSAALLAFVAPAVMATEFPSTLKEFEAVDNSSVESLFGRFKEHFAKEYVSSADEAHHLSIFSQKVKEIFEFNERGGTAFKKGINRFSDLGEKDRQSFVMAETSAARSKSGRKSGSASDKDAKNQPASRALKLAPNTATCDLRPYTTSVKNQASCGSCWAFGTNAAAEASHFLWAMTDAAGNIRSTDTNSNDMWQLSEQTLVECCDSCNGCGGGGTWEPMQCAVDMGALPSAMSNPYTATDNSTCTQPGASAAAAGVSSWYQPCDLDEECLKSYIGGDDCTTFFTTAFKTSIQVIDSFYDYTDGVYSVDDCPSDKHNHAVAIVGWGTDAASGMDYWIMRNSWGESWGQGGYFYMQRGVNMCCVACDNLFFQ
jgi:cathepsin H